MGTKTMRIRDPNWKYYPASETMKAGYLQRRMKEYRKQVQRENEKPVLTEPRLTGVGMSCKP